MGSFHAGSVSRLTEPARCRSIEVLGINTATTESDAARPTFFGIWLPAERTQ